MCQVVTEWRSAASGAVVRSTSEKYTAREIISLRQGTRKENRTVWQERLLELDRELRASK